MTTQLSPVTTRQSLPPRKERVDTMARQIDAYTTKEVLTTSLPETMDRSKLMPAPFKYKQEIAAELDDVFKNRPDLIERVLDPQGEDNRLSKPTTFILSTNKKTNVRNGSSFTAGLATSQHEIYLHKAAADRNRKNRRDGKDVIVHEFVHQLDRSNRIDGLLPGISPQQKQLFEQGRARLFDKHDAKFAKKYDAEERAKIRKDPKHPWWMKQSIKGIDNYTFFNNKEFLASSVEVFKDKPELLKKESPELLRFYEDYFQLDSGV